MKKKLFIALLVCTSFSMKAQFFGRKSLGISQGAIFFNATSLNNKNNANNKTSWVSELDKSFFLSRYAGFNMGGGIGNYKNPDNRFEAYQSTNFYRLKFALCLHLPSHNNSNPNLVSPFFQVGYNFDILNNTFKAIGSNRVSANMKVGGGVAFRMTNEIGLFYGFTLNQRINSDYRTFYQHSIGILVNLEKKMGNN